MKKTKKILSLAMALCLGSGCLLGAAACGGTEEDYGDKTVLRIGLFEGGWGSEWLNKVIAKFESEYPEYKVLVDGDKTKYNQGSLLATIDTGRQDLFIAPMYLYDAVSQNKFMDITELMNTPLNEIVTSSSDTATIQSKMWSDLDEYYKSYNNEGKYYSIPFGGGIYSLNYDRDLFDRESLFIKAGTGINYDGSGTIEWVNESASLSVGQDGEAGTFDDGLPVTYNDFKALLVRMKQRNVIPFIWSKENSYLNNFLNSFIASYEGKDNFNLFKTMDGEYTFAGDTTATQITKDNAYLLQGMTGKKNAIQFAYDLVLDSANYHQDSGRETCDFLAAQNKYLLSVDLAKSGMDKPVAFLIDGAHWYNEAKSTIDEMAAESDDYKDRRFGIMPFPKMEGTKATKATYYASSFTQQVFIRKHAEQPELAKLFLAYLHTEESLRTCTQYSGMVRPLAYTMPTELLNTMPYYYQSLWNAFKDADIVHNLSTNPYVYKNESFFEYEWLFTCHTSSGVNLSCPISDFMVNTKKAIGVNGYVEAMAYTFNADKWEKDVLSKAGV